MVYLPVLIQFDFMLLYRLQNFSVYLHHQEKLLFASDSLDPEIFLIQGQRFSKKNL